VAKLLISAAWCSMVVSILLKELMRVPTSLLRRTRPPITCSLAISCAIRATVPPMSQMM
jgi:hypothetical protein